jgi:outer membrane lipoprotein SlyB
MGRRRQYAGARWRHRHVDGVVVVSKPLAAFYGALAGGLLGAVLAKPEGSMAVAMLGGALVGAVGGALAGSPSDPSVAMAPAASSTGTP